MNQIPFIEQIVIVLGCGFIGPSNYFTLTKEICAKSKYEELILE